MVGVPHVADVGEQHGEVAEPQRLLLGGQAQFGNGPDQSIDHRVEQTQQLVPALQLLGRLRRAGPQIWRRQQMFSELGIYTHIMTDED